MRLNELSKRSATTACRKRWRLVWGTACSALVLLAGCGGDDAATRPELPPGVGDRLAAQADQVADALEAGDACLAADRAKTLQQSVTNAIDAGRVERPLRRPLRSAVADLVATIECAPPPAEEEPAPEEEQANTCAELEAAKQELEAQKQELEGEAGEGEQDKGEQDKGEKEGQKKELDEQLKTIEEQLKECERGNGDGEEEGDD